MTLSIASRKDTRVTRYECILTIELKTKVEGLLDKLEKCGVTKEGALVIPVTLISSDINSSVSLVSRVLGDNALREMGWVDKQASMTPEEMVEWIKSACRVYKVNAKGIALILAVTLLKELYLGEEEIDILISELN